MYILPFDNGILDIQERDMKALFAITLLCIFGTGLAVAETYPLGVEIFSGYDMPVIQDDVGAGTMFGLSVRGHVWGPFHGELFFRSTSQGDKDETLEFGGGVPNETVTYPGGTLSGFGANLLLAKSHPVSVWPYLQIGLSSNSLKPGSSVKKDETLMGWSFGGGTGINLYNHALYLDVNTNLLVMPFHDNNASRKNWQTRAGIQYFIPINMK